MDGTTLDQPGFEHESVEAVVLDQVLEQSRTPAVPLMHIMRALAKGDDALVRNHVPEEAHVFIVIVMTRNGQRHDSLARPGHERLCFRGLVFTSVRHPLPPGNSRRPTLLSAVSHRTEHDLPSIPLRGITVLAAPAPVSRARRVVSDDETVHRDGTPGSRDQRVDVDLGNLPRQRRAQHRESGHRLGQRVDVGARFPPSAAQDAGEAEPVEEAPRVDRVERGKGVYPLVKVLDQRCRPGPARSPDRRWDP